MVVFLVQGIDYDGLMRLVDSSIVAASDGLPFMIGSIDGLEVECFDSEMGKTYEGAAALAMIIEYRMKSRKTE